MALNNGIVIIPAKFAGRCSHCGARIQVGKAIVKTASGKWIHAECPKDVPPAPEQARLAHNRAEIVVGDEPDEDRVWAEVDAGLRECHGNGYERRAFRTW